MSSERYLFIAYDITDNSLRKRVHDLCKYFGLVRIQYSAFKGFISQRDKNLLVSRLKEIELGADDKIHIIDLCTRCINHQLVLGAEEEEQVGQHIVI